MRELLVLPATQVRHHVVVGRRVRAVLVMAAAPKLRIVLTAMAAPVLDVGDRAEVGAGRGAAGGGAEGALQLPGQHRGPARIWHRLHQRVIRLAPQNHPPRGSCEFTAAVVDRRDWVEVRCGGVRAAEEDWVYTAAVVDRRVRVEVRCGGVHAARDLPRVLFNTTSWNTCIYA